MEDEINIRPYLDTLIKNWIWIIGAGILFALIAFGISSVLAPTYSATAIVAITEPYDIVEFDPRIRSTDENQPLKAYPELATSDTVLEDLLTEIAPVTSDIATIGTLRGLLEASAGSDPSLLRLTASFGDSQATSEIANIWAEIFVAKANEVYGGSGGNRQLFFETQLNDVGQELETAEQALIDFQATNRAAIIENELAALQLTQANYLENQQSTLLLIQDVQSLREQIARQPGNGNVTFADQLTALLLQVKAFNAETETPLQLQLNTTEPVTWQNKNEQLGFLDNLIETLSTRSMEIDTSLADLEPKILVLQQQKQETETENNRVTRNFTLSEETYTALARKVEEERITSQDVSSGVKLASKSAVPENPVAPKRTLNTIVAGFLGLLLGAIAVLFFSWWKNHA